MRDVLAERLLAEVMAWEPEQIAEERPVLQAMAALKYDEYQQFSPGMRFVESLAEWLSQFETIEERRTAYGFVRDRLVFISVAEMDHFVRTAYPDHVRPLLLRKRAEECDHNSYHLGRIADTPEFRSFQRQCLFLGLSDGARTDVFRRANRSDLTHEQVLQTHEISEQRTDDLLDELKCGLASLHTESADTEIPRFRVVVFLDDFSGSGLSCLREEDDVVKGKIRKFYNEVTTTGSPTARLVDLEDLEVFLILYVASESAMEHLEKSMKEIWDPIGVKCRVLVVQLIRSDIALKREDSNPMARLFEKYYDPRICDHHIKKGGTDGRYGFADGGLPLVLSHNCPNNSVSLLWAYEDCTPRGLFPRVPRHKIES